MTIKGEEPKMMIIDDPGLDVDMQERGREILRLWYESMIKTRPPGVYFGGRFNLPPKETTMTDIFRKKYTELTPHNQQALDTVKDEAIALYAAIELQGNSRETSLAKTKLEECVFWATKHITDPARQL